MERASVHSAQSSAMSRSGLILPASAGKGDERMPNPDAVPHPESGRLFPCAPVARAGRLTKWDESRPVAVR